ncbi:DUF2232 domain-containing protein [Marinobacter sp. X15-166B]|uniref:DUF2232 domain-containing protein n=1 Tax=Marinobacter sp. X15-166B TaxID=1897620 RepID=UPI00085C1892|nr:DUF2232 domain-containing protein [Marinobacter sp. X15-166B]OEY66772.1 hypothetical protein BG841_10110 [Marinobacter sp. X15-166B]
MRALARFVMRGPLQAGGVAAASIALPLLFWIGAAVTGLVILRLGIRQGLNIGLWALLPAIGWAWVGQDPTALAVLLMTMVMAAVLRTTSSWEKTLVSGSVLAIVAGFMLPALYPGLLDQLVNAGVQFYEQYNADLARSMGSSLEVVIRQTMEATMAGSFLVTGMAMTMLARSWQAGIDNPGGFRREFHALRLSVPIATLCVATTLVGPYLGLSPVLLVWAGGLPLLVAAVALVHGVIGRKNMGVQWLVLFYIALLLLGPSLMFLLLVLAYVDSWLNIRGRMKPGDSAE